MIRAPKKAKWLIINAPYKGGMPHIFKMAIMDGKTGKNATLD
jgi:hypothetical protein